MIPILFFVIPIFVDGSKMALNGNASLMGEQSLINRQVIIKKRPGRALMALDWLKSCLHEEPGSVMFCINMRKSRKTSSAPLQMAS